MIPNNAKAQLYVAAKGFPDIKQYQESEQALKLLEDNGLLEKIGVSTISSMIEYGAVNIRDDFDLITTTGDTGLPFLRCVYSDPVTGLPRDDGHSGIEAITKELDRLEVLKKD